MKISLKYLIFLLIIFSCTKDNNKTVINIWHQMLYENRQVLREVCDQYEESHTGIKINLTYRETEELRSNFQAAAMGGSGPELIYGPSDQVGPFSIMGIIQPLENLLPTDFFSQFVDNAIVKSNGNIWMIGDVVGNHLMLIYNQNLVHQPPRDTNELIRIGKKIQVWEIKVKDDNNELICISRLSLAVINKN